MDIANTPINDLFTRLSQSVEAKQRQKKAKQKKARKKVEVDKRPLFFRTEWTEEAIILLIHRVTCQCCEHTFEYPNDTLLLRHRNHFIGTHCKPLLPGEHYPELPHFTETIYKTVAACQHCHGLAYTIDNALRSPEQFTLSRTTGESK